VQKRLPVTEMIVLDANILIRASSESACGNFLRRMQHTAFGFTRRKSRMWMQLSTCRLS